MWVAFCQDVPWADGDDYDYDYYYYYHHHHHRRYHFYTEYLKPEKKLGLFFVYIMLQLFCG
jgi:hypothetical protein